MANGVVVVIIIVVVAVAVVVVVVVVVVVIGVAVAGDFIVVREKFLLRRTGNNRFVR